jgi:hypothetical protein
MGIRSSVKGIPNDSQNGEMLALDLFAVQSRDNTQCLKLTTSTK